LIALLIPLLITLALAHHTLSDLDIWLHLRAGEQIVSGEGVPDRNGYSFTASEERWVDHEWLFQAVVAAIAQTADTDEPASVANRWHLLRVLLAVAIVALLLPGKRGRDHHTVATGRTWPQPVYLVPVFLVGLALLWPRLIIRPELFSYAALLLVLPRIERALGLLPQTTGPTLGTWRDLFSVHHPAGQAFWLTVIWAQLHGFFALAGAVWAVGLITAAVPVHLRRRQHHGSDPTGVRSSRRPAPMILALAATGLALAAGLLTPSGVAGLLYPLRALAQLGEGGVDLSETIGEMVPLGRTFGALANTILIYRLSLIWSLIWIVLTWGRVGWLRILLVVVGAWATWESQRAIGFYALAFVLLHTGYGDGDPVWWRRYEPLDRLATRFESGPGALVSGMAVLGVSVVFAVIWLAALASNDFYLGEGVARRFGGGLTPAHYPVHVAAELARDPAAMRLRVVNNLDAAGYLVGHRAGRVYIDGRTEAYPAELWHEYRQLLAGGESALAILRKRRTDRICLAYGSGTVQPLLRTLLGAADWELTAVDESGILWQPRQSLPNGPAAADLLTEARDRLLTALPGPEQRYDGAGSRTGAADRCAALAGLMEVAGRPDDAHRLLRRGLLYAPDHAQLSHNLGNLLLSRSEYTAAAVLFERAARGNRRAVGTRINLAVCYYRLGRLSAAEDALLAALAIDPRRGSAWANLAEVRRRHGDRSGAMAAYSRAVELLPDDRNLRGRAATYRNGRR